MYMWFRGVCRGGKGMEFQKPGRALPLPDLRHVVHIWVVVARLSRRGTQRRPANLPSYRGAGVQTIVFCRAGVHVLLVILILSNGEGF